MEGSRTTHDMNLASRKAEEAGWRRFQAAGWLESLVGPIGVSTHPSEREFVSCGRNGLVLCNAINKIHLGSVPKILNPNPDAMSKMITENASEEFLYSLSNYCVLQGFVEDQFGLPLIARAVEERIAVIKPMGIMIFNMAGRPGQGVCKRLFERRGFRVTKLCQTKVIQAADIDISSLVEIEKNSPHRLEFFMGLTGDHPICARTAWAYGKAGGRISHAISVYSCQLREPNQVRNSFSYLFVDIFFT